MTEDDLEKIIKKAVSISFVYGYSGFFGDSPGNITLFFHQKDQDDCFNFWKSLQKECENHKVKVGIKQTGTDMIDFTLMIEKTPAIILVVNRVNSKADRIEMFLKKHPVDMGFHMFVRVNEPSDTLENMAARSEASLEARIHEGIYIDSWDGTKL